jgi:obg-like ATPase 1
LTTECRLPKIKAWIDENNPGDPLIPFSVALEERLALMSPEEKKEEEQKIGTTSALPKITQAGYTSLHVSCVDQFTCA